MNPVSVPRLDTRAIRLIPALSLAIGVSIISGCATVDDVRNQISEKLGRDKSPTEQTATAVPVASPNASLAGQIQEKLTELGYKPGRITGKSNSRTEAAIQDFQLDNDLRVDGRVSVTLLETLNAALANR